MMFFDGDDRTLRFVEHAPADVHETDHDVCGCTRNVIERPSGKPHEVRPVIVLHARRDPFTIEFDLTSQWLTFKFDEPLPAVQDAAHPANRKMRSHFHGIKKPDPHAYFMFGENKLNIEIALDGYGLTDCFFAHVFIGNKVDTSTMMNGHSPSRIVDLSKIGADDVWVHDCICGPEAMRILPSICTNLYRTMNEDMNAMRTRIRPYALDLMGEVSVSVTETRKRLMNDVTMYLAQKNLEALSEFLLNLPTQELYKAVLSLNRELWEKADRA
jgi:hypothetical protein